MTTYHCAKCQAPATVANGIVLRMCACDGTVVANISAVARGVSTVASS